MNYIISDIHGDKKKFLQMLKLVSFDSHTDRLYILGDVLDRGKYGIDIIRFIMPFIKAGSIILIKGNHELFCQYYLSGDFSEKRWINYGGEYTLKSLKMMSEDEKKQLSEFLKQLPLYFEMETKRWGKVCLTHSGICLERMELNQQYQVDVVESIKSAVKYDEYKYLISDDLHLMGKATLSVLDKYIICGHIPTYTSYMDSPNRIYIGSHYMDVDCGCGFENGVLGCYCVDSQECYYV